MLIDWFTVFAQIINFLVLVWLLKRFLYGRIIRAIDVRELRIAEQVAAADATRAEAQAQLEQYENQLSALDQQRESLLAQAKVDAERQHTELLERARREVRDLELRWQEELERQHETFRLNLCRRIASEVLDMTRSLIADLTSSDLEQCATDVFLQKLRSVDRDVWLRLGDSDLLVSTARELPEHQRTRIRQEIEACSGTPLNLRFEHDASLGLGVELRGNGWRMGWTSEAYLESLQEDLNEALNEECGPRLAADQARA